MWKGKTRVGLALKLSAVKPCPKNGLDGLNQDTRVAFSLSTIGRLASKSE